MIKEDIHISVEKTQHLMASIAEQIISAKTPERLLQTTIIGIQVWGVEPACWIGDYIFKKTGIKIPVGSLDISMYRDDIGRGRALPIMRETNIPFNIDETHLILLDDVLHKGRTIRAALDALTDYGRPATIQLAILIDRGGRELPIQPDYIGMTCTDLTESQWVRITL